ncbi:MAG: phosphate signaling complex protein PhoU [Candidatus Thermoplasmatota archaeon]|nr:phosphate signaling complex protein PhoU [Candidatus Thermoplasmatota archaeon]
MPDKFDHEMGVLNDNIRKMGSISRKMLLDAVGSLKDRDRELAKQVLSMKRELYDLDHTIEEHTLRVLTLYQPMAKDMRNLACILKMITYLTRIGRYGYDIAKITIEIADQPHVKKLIDIPFMADHVASMIDDVLQAWETEDLSLIEDLEERDDILDEKRYTIFRECLTYMMEDPKTITRCTHYIMVARYLERCGDHCCKIAEKVVYKVKGEHVEIS